MRCGYLTSDNLVRTLAGMADGLATNQDQGASSACVNGTQPIDPRWRESGHDGQPRRPAPALTSRASPARVCWGVKAELSSRAEPGCRLRA